MFNYLIFLALWIIFRFLSCLYIQYFVGKSTLFFTVFIYFLWDASHCSGCVITWFQHFKVIYTFPFIQHLFTRCSYFQTLSLFPRRISSPCFLSQLWFVFISARWLLLRFYIEDAIHVFESANALLIFGRGYLWITYDFTKLFKILLSRDSIFFILNSLSPFLLKPS